MATIDQVVYIKVSPGIGMARVGNSPESFIGPEAPGIAPSPPDNSFKDAEGRVKPMACRFRVYGYNDAGEAIMEFVHDPSGPNQTTLTWNAHLLNKKAANYAFQGKFGFNSCDMRNPGVQGGMLPDERSQLIIDPGMQQISGISQAPIELAANIFEGVSTPGVPNINIPTSNILGSYGASGNTLVEYIEKRVYLGQLETDTQGRLVIVGGKGEAGSLTSPATIIQKGPSTYTSGTDSGKEITDPNANGNLYFNNPGWYDDTAGGVVQATVSFVNTNGVTVTLNTTDSQTITPASGPSYTLEAKNKQGWISVAPPKYVPSMRNVVSILDLQLNIFPEEDPNAGEVDLAYLDNTGAIQLYSSRTGGASDFAGQAINTDSGSTAGPALAAFNQKIYCAISGNGGNLIGSAATNSDPFDFEGAGTNPISTNVSPSLAVFNGLLHYAVVELETNNIYIATSSTGDFSSATFTQQTLKLATTLGLKNTTVTTNLAVSLAAYGGNLYLALTDTNGDHYLAVASTETDNQFNLQKVGGGVAASNLAPSIAVFDGRLYYAITDTGGASWIDSWNNFAPQTPLNPLDTTQATPKFVYNFTQISEAPTTNQAPAISAFNGKLYYLVNSNGSNYLGTKGPLLHVVTEGTTGEQEPAFTFNSLGETGNAANSAIADFESISFFRDIYPILKTVTDYAWVNQPAFNGHGPGTNGDFLRGRYLKGISNTNEANNFARVFVFNLIRPAGWLTDVPPPPWDFRQASVPVQENQRGSLMPHLAGTGGSADENIFNGTKYPNQWLSLTRHQLNKFQKWVNGDFFTGVITVPKPLDKYEVAEQPRMSNFGALDLTVGGGFHPGIELTYYVDLPEYFCEPFRVNDAVTYGRDSVSITPGSLAGYMSVPWHGDFWSCNTDFWAAQRPDIVLKVTPQEGPTPLLEPINWFRSTNLNIPEDASSNTKWLYGENPEHFDGNHTTYQTFLKYWSYFGFVTKTTKTIEAPEGGKEVNVYARDIGEDERQETERAKCLDNPVPLCPAVNERSGPSLPTTQSALTISSDGNNYTLSGQIRQKGAAATNLRVEAYDQDLLKKDDYLGTATTDSNGQFSISFNKSDFADWIFDKHPDLYFKIYDGEKLLKETSDNVLKDATGDLGSIIINV